MTLLKKALTDAGIPFSESFETYLSLLQKWNQVYNLVASSEEETLIYEHLLDSLSALPYLEGNRFLDLGSGGGFPGIPLAIACPERHFILLDSRSKKTRFLEQARIACKLSNVQVITARAEDLVLEEKVEAILTRAFGTLKEIVTLSEPLLKPNGIIYAWKAKTIEEEIAELPSAWEASWIPLSHHGSDKTRGLVKIMTAIHG